MNNEKNADGLNVRHPIVVGQKVWVYTSSFFGSKKEPFEATVSKVGKKYFELAECPRQKYDLKTLKQVTESICQNKIYLKLQDILDEKEHQRLSDEIKRAFNGNAKLKYSLEQLRKIAEIICLQ
jgi:hypothetical protein